MACGGGSPPRGGSSVLRHTGVQKRVSREFRLCLCLGTAAAPGEAWDCPATGLSTAQKVPETRCGPRPGARSFVGGKARVTLGTLGETLCRSPKSLPSLSTDNKAESFLVLFGEHGLPIVTPEQPGDPSADFLLLRGVCEEA